MKTVETVAELRELLSGSRRAGCSIGFVPTMGALHEGHLSLVRRARAECKVTVVSIFVNPTQFGPSEDFSRYPRDLERDSRLLAECGVDAIFAPSAAEIYPPGDGFNVEAPPLAARWEGEVRPGHFRGVATVCAKLFNIVQADRAYFGSKDYQQLALMRRLVVDLFIPTTIVPCQTVREPDGLALSSRNAYLSPDQRSASTCLFRALELARAYWWRGERSARTIVEQMAARVAAEPLAALDYAAIVDPNSLEPVETATADSMALVAARLGATRLIDNVELGSRRPLEWEVGHPVRLP